MRLTILAALAAMALPAPLLAQDTDKQTTRTVTERDDDRDGEFPWGLLGLAGLAGLLGLKRKEPDIHVDARRPPR